MSDTDANIPDIEKRFLAPEGWRWHSFTRQGRRIRCGAVSPRQSVPDAAVICLPGLSEFGEKYLETARTCHEMNLAFWVIDWMGQGGSGRYLENPHKRHATCFADDVDDLHYFYTNYIKQACVHPDTGAIPVVMLAHSMGANIGLHYLKRHPDIFKCAAFSAPMFGIEFFAGRSMSLIRPLSLIFKTFMGRSYVQGGHDWDPALDAVDGARTLSGDPVRARLQDQWFAARPQLQVGSPTYGWLYHALSACAAMDESFLNTIATPCLVALAGRESVVDNARSRQVATGLIRCKTIDFPEARHEILMERDDIRAQFFQAFHALITENTLVRPQSLQPS